MSGASVSPREEVRCIYDAALAAVEPAAAVRRALKRAGGHLIVGAHHVELPRRVRLIGAGKAAAPMARAAAEILGDRLTDGVVVVKRGHGEPLPAGLRLFEAGHPVPDEDGLLAAAAVHELAASSTAGDLVIVLISGGASALLPCPVEGVSLTTLQTVTDALLRAGADIGELNAVRRRLDRLKGGGLARLLRPARFLTLALSDVLGDDPATLGSGPTWAPDDPAPYVIVASLEHALQAAVAEAQRRGWPVTRWPEPLVGEARDVGQALARGLLGSPAPACLVAGGEPTVTVRGDGSGGRAQELALAAAMVLRGSPGVLLSAGTDGTDGPTDVAGAIVDGGSCGRTDLDPLAHLARNDSTPWLRSSGDALVTGPTRTNVGDLVIGLLPRS